MPGTGRLLDRVATHRANATAWLDPAPRNAVVPPLFHCTTSSSRSGGSRAADAPPPPIARLLASAKVLEPKVIRVWESYRACAEDPSAKILLDHHHCPSTSCDWPLQSKVSSSLPHRYEVVDHLRPAMGHNGVGGTAGVRSDLRGHTRRLGRLQRGSIRAVPAAPTWAASAAMRMAAT
jgi:hypothetical protein